VKVRYLPPAEAELAEALSWYHQRSPVSAQRFDEEVAIVDRLLTRHPQVGTPAGRLGVRLFRVHGFPYMVVYAAEPGEIVVIAMAHQRRQAAYWMDRLKKAR
jgi:plasmid stabilization system protein ParE